MLVDITQPTLLSDPPSDRIIHKYTHLLTHIHPSSPPAAQLHRQHLGWNHQNIQRLRSLPISWHQHQPPPKATLHTQKELSMKHTSRCLQKWPFRLFKMPITRHSQQLPPFKLLIILCKVIVITRHTSLRRIEKLIPSPFQC